MSCKACNCHNVRLNVKFTKILLKLSICRRNCELGWALLSGRMTPFSPSRRTHHVVRRIVAACSSRRYHLIIMPIFTPASVCEQRWISSKDSGHGFGLLKLFGDGYRQQRMRNSLHIAAAPPSCPTPITGPLKYELVRLPYGVAPHLNCPEFVQSDDNHLCSQTLTSQLANYETHFSIIFLLLGSTLTPILLFIWYIFKSYSLINTRII